MLHYPCYESSLCEISDYSAQGASSESDSEGDVPGQYCAGELCICETIVLSSILRSMYPISLLVHFTQG
jgi:hypothetical protein